MPMAEGRVAPPAGDGGGGGGDGGGRPSGEALHLVRRFLGSLWPGGPGARDEAWAVAELLPGEVGLWRRMSGADRRHAVGVARRTADELGPAASRPILAAALLHDVGKVDSGFGPWRRSIATVLGVVFGHRRASGWRYGRGPLARVGSYLSHDEIGADLRAGAGSDTLTVRWAREHHLPATRWTVPQAVGRALKRADDD